MPRFAGNTVPHEVHTTREPVGLPMEERETREEARARIEAKRQRDASRSPFAQRSTPEQVAKADHVRPVVDETRAALVYESPEFDVSLEATPATQRRQAAMVEEFAAANPSTAKPVALAAPAPVVAKPRPTAPKPSTWDPAGIVQDYLAGMTVAAIAKARHHQTHAVRELLKSTPGIELRDDRKANGGKPKTYEPAVVDAIRNLYGQGLTQAGVADRLGITVKVVQTIMRRHNIEARGDATTLEPREQTGSANAAAELKAALAEHGVTSAELREWAHEHGMQVAPRGLPSARVLDAWLMAQGRTDKGADARKMRRVIDAAATFHDVGAHKADLAAGLVDDQPATSTELVHEPAPEPAPAPQLVDADPAPEPEVTHVTVPTEPETQGLDEPVPYLPVPALVPDVAATRVAGIVDEALAAIQDAVTDLVVATEGLIAAEVHAVAHRIQARAAATRAAARELDPTNGARS